MWRVTYPPSSLRCDYFSECTTINVASTCALLEALVGCGNLQQTPDWQGKNRSKRSRIHLRSGVVRFWYYLAHEWVLFFSHLAVSRFPSSCTTCYISEAKYRFKHTDLTQSKMLKCSAPSSIILACENLSLLVCYHKSPLNGVRITQNFAALQLLGTLLCNSNRNLK